MDNIINTLLETINNDPDNDLIDTSTSDTSNGTPSDTSNGTPNNTPSDTPSDMLSEVTELIDQEDESDNITLDENKINDTILNMNNTMGYGCGHYMRRCKLFAKCCNEYFYCHMCHDEIHNVISITNDLHHELDRYSVEKIKCTKCDTEQQISKFCNNCGICFGFYFCDKCKIIDDVDRDYYHCDKCKICRVGFGKKYKHCDKCNICFAEDFVHKCIEVDECPICCDSLTKSVSSIQKLRCGHSLHPKCYVELAKTSYRCPMCQKSMYDMSAQFKNIDTHIELNPMPDEFKNDDGTNKTVSVYCIDCEHTGDTVFHFIGLKCSNNECGSYNTKQS